jgi:hypothetical protein
MWEATAMSEIVAERTSWSYVDVMATALALLPDVKLVAADKTWNKAWQRVIAEPDLKALLPDVWFEDRAPYPALSDQVESLRRVLLRSGVLSLGNPRYTFFSIETEAKASIQRANQELLNSERGRLEKMARLLGEELRAA